MKISFFIPLEKVPRTTHQQKKISYSYGRRPIVYEPKKLLNTRRLYQTMLCKYRPSKPMQGAISLSVRWCFDYSKGHSDGEWKITRPDTDNLNKLLKDVMTELNFWHDDSQVVREHIEKVWSKNSGIHITVEAL